MNSTINLDQIIRKLDGRTSTPVAGEEVLVTIDLGTGEAVAKTFGVRFGGNYQDYLVSNERNPTRSGGGKLAAYYVRDVQNRRTLALDIEVISCVCPAHAEGKVAESLHGEQSPSQIFAGLLERWTREFISPGDEGRFIDTYDAAREPLERYLTRRASEQTGLALQPKVSLSANADVQRDIIIVGPVEIGVRLQDYKQQQGLTIEAGLPLDGQHYVRAYVFQEGRESPEELFKRHLREYFEQRVTFQQFTKELQHPGLKQQLLQALSAALLQVGRRVSFINFSTSKESNTAAPPEFVAVTFPYNHNILGRAHPVVIHNTVQLYCENSAASAAFFASSEANNEGSRETSNEVKVQAWVKSKLNVILKRHLIGQTYVGLLLRFAPLEESIKRELSMRAADIGYKVDHLVSIPHLKELDLTSPFDLNFDHTFETKLDNFEVQLKFDFTLFIPNLQTVEKCLNRDADVKEAIRGAVLSEARQLLRNIHPERFYLYFNHPNEEVQEAGERQAVKELLDEKIAERLKQDFGAEILAQTTRVGRTDLTERYKKLCFDIRHFSVSIEPPDPQGTESLVLTGDFEVRGVHPDSKGWQRFSTMRLDLDGLQTQLQNHLKAELKGYYQSSFMFQNRVARQQVFKVVESYATQYMQREFGLMINLTNLDRNTTKAERGQHELLNKLEEEKLNAALDEGKDLVDRLNGLKKKRIRLLSISPVDKEELREIEENIRLLQDELASITSARFGQHQLAATLESQRPDQLPGEGEVSHVAIQYELGSEQKGQLTD